MGLFSGIRDAELFERGKFLKPSFYGTLLIKRTIAKETMRSGLAFIVEFEVVSTNMPDEHPVGSKVSWFQKMTDKTVAFPSIKAFAAAVAGYEIHQKDQIEEEVAPALEELLDAAVENETDNDLVGLCVNVQTEHTKTQRGLDFTRHLWMPYRGSE